MSQREGGFLITQIHHFGRRVFTELLKKHDMEMDGGWGDAERWRQWVTKEAMDYCDGLFQKALAAVNDNPTYLNHVRRAYLEVLWGSIMINLQPQTDFSNKDLSLQPGVDAEDVKRRIRLFVEIMRENGYNMLSEIVPFNPANYSH